MLTVVMGPKPAVGPNMCRNLREKTTVSKELLTYLDKKGKESAIGGSLGHAGHSCQFSSILPAGPRLSRGRLVMGRMMGQVPVSPSSESLLCLWRALLKHQVLSLPAGYLGFHWCGPVSGQDSCSHISYFRLKIHPSNNIRILKFC